MRARIGYLRFAGITSNIRLHEPCPEHAYDLHTWSGEFISTTHELTVGVLVLA